MVEIVNKKTGEVIIFPTPDHSKPETKIDTLPPDEIELCVVCHKPTIYTRYTHIDNRLYYEYGIGQLCRDCYNDIYK